MSTYDEGIEASGEEKNSMTTESTHRIRLTRSIRFVLPHGVFATVSKGEVGFIRSVLADRFNVSFPPNCIVPDREMPTKWCTVGLSLDLFEVLSDDPEVKNYTGFYRCQTSQPGRVALRFFSIAQSRESSASHGQRFRCYYTALLQGVHRSLVGFGQARSENYYFVSSINVKMFPSRS